MDSVHKEIDKTLKTSLSKNCGAISIRVVVLQKPSNVLVKTLTPEEAEGNEPLIDTGKTAVSSYLENPKRGRECAVFLVNGQKQHAWDNSFIQTDLDFKYLRNRMMVIVEIDDLNPEAIARLMQGSRSSFYEGEIYDAIAIRVISTLKDDPDLKRLEGEAEDEIYQLKSGDEAIKKTLDKLIEDHHNLASRIDMGTYESGESLDSGINGPLLTEKNAVTITDPTLGMDAGEPLLIMVPDIATIRIKPNEIRQLNLTSRPMSEWKNITEMDICTDPPIKELSITKNMYTQSGKVDIFFEEPSNFDSDEYPIETNLQITAIFDNQPDIRLVERRVVINRPRIAPPPIPLILLDDPSYLKVISRQPVKFYPEGSDVHVKLKWDGKDHLGLGDNPVWIFQAKCLIDRISPIMTFSNPSGGRIELLIQTPAGIKVGDRFDFEVEAVGPEGKSLLTGFSAEVVDAPKPRKITVTTRSGMNRRPPYELRYIEKDNYSQETCWGNTEWTQSDPGCFQAPTATSPLILIINNDMKELEWYREKLLAKKLVEGTVHQRITRYSSHIAFHLYQMYRNWKTSCEAPSNENDYQPKEEDMSYEIKRVATTLLKLMET